MLYVGPAKGRVNGRRETACREGFGTMGLHVLGWHMMLILRLMGVLLVAGIGLATLNPAAAVTAGASPWVEREHAAVRLISASDTVGVGDTLSLALEFRLARDWKIYWRSPGDAGYPPALDWAGSANIADATIAWPAPEFYRRNHIPEDPGEKR